MEVDLKGPGGSKTLLAVYSPSKPVEVRVRPTGAELKETSNAASLFNGVEGWAWNGENLVFIGFAGGDGATLEARF